MTTPVSTPISMPLDLREEIPIRNGLPREDLERIRAFRRRVHLEQSEVMRALRDEIEAITYAMEYRRPPRPAPRPDRRFLRAVTWNIERGNRLDALKAYLASQPEITGCDVLLLNEVDIGMARSGNRNVAAEIGAQLGFEHVFGNSYLCLGYGDVRDGAPSGENSVGMHGNAILSRYPIARAENISIAITRDKFESSERRLGHKKALWAEIDTPLGKLPVVSVHLDPYASPLQRRDQMRDVRRTLERRGLASRVLLGGDLNTATYDVENLGGLLRNLLMKLVRGGFPHAMYHYMHPHELYEKPLFDELAAAGIEFLPFNAMDAGTLRYEVGTFDSESKVREHLPGIAVSLLRWKLRPWNGVAPIKVDWFAGRGVRALKDGEEVDPDGRRSLSPRVFERARWQGGPLSDHDPLLVDITF